MVFWNYHIQPCSCWHHAFVVILSLPPSPWSLVSLFSIFKSAKNDEGKIDPALGERDGSKWPLWGPFQPFFTLALCSWELSCMLPAPAGAKANYGVHTWLQLLYWEKQSSAASALTLCFYKYCAGETGRSRAPSWVRCPHVIPTALSESVLGWFPQAPCGALGHWLLPGAWLCQMPFAAGPGTRHLTVLCCAAIAGRWRVLADLAEHRDLAASCTKVCQTAMCQKHQDNARGTWSGRFHPGFELCFS